VRAEGIVNNAATIHNPQIVAPVARHVGCEETQTWRGYTVTLYRWKLSTAIEYAVRMTDIRKQNDVIGHQMSPLNHAKECSKIYEKTTVKYMISLIAKLRIYMLGTVRISLLHAIMMITMTLPVVPNIKRTAYIGTL
jgi:hypothetical protein